MNQSFEEENNNESERSESPYIELQKSTVTPPKNSNNNQSYHIIEPKSNSLSKRDSAKFEERIENNEDQESEPNQLEGLDYTVFDPLPDKWS